MYFTYNLYIVKTWGMCRAGSYRVEYRRTFNRNKNKEPIAAERKPVPERSPLCEWLLINRIIWFFISKHLSFVFLFFFSSLETPLYGLDERWLCSNCTSATPTAAANNIFNCFHFEDDLMMTWKEVYYGITFSNVLSSKMWLEKRRVELLV